jgi:hypothetical protein
MRWVRVILCVIGLLFAVDGAGAGPPLRLSPAASATPSAGQSSPATRSQSRTTRRNGTSENGSSRDGADENGSERNGTDDSTAQRSGAARQDGDDSDGDEEVDSSDLFGFTEGSDTSAKDTRVLTHDVVARNGRRFGFGGLRGSLSFLHSPTDALQLSVSVDSDYEQERFDPLAEELRGSLAFGVSGSAKYRIWEREKDSVIGLAVQVAPYWLRGSELTGGILQRYGAEVRLIADHEIVLKKLFVALNLAFNPERRHWPDGSTTQASLIEASAAFSARVTDTLYLGAELRYLAHFDGAFLERFGGWAVFAGPTLYASLSDSAYIGAGWSMQIAGEAAAEPGLNLDLVHFERHQVRIKSGFVF